MSNMFDQAVASRPGNAEVWMVGQGDDSGLVVQFYEGSEEDEGATLKEGRPIFRTMERIKIFTPGDSLTVVDEAVNDTHRHRFAQQYQQYKATEQDVPSEGTPLAEWPLLKEAQRRELKYKGFHTVEQVAAVSDQTISMNGPFGDVLHKLRGHATAYLAKAKDGALERKLQAQLDELKAQNEALQAQLQQIGQIRAQNPQIDQQAAQAPQDTVAVQPVGMELGPIAEPEALGGSSLDAIPELEPADPEPAPRKRGRPRKNPEG